MTAWSDLRSFRRRATAASAALAMGRGALRAVPVVAGVLTVAAVADRVLGLPGFARQAAWWAAVGGGAAALASGFLPLALFRPGSQSRALAARAAGGFREDDLRIAVELENDRSDGSPELRDAFVSTVVDRLKRTRASWCFPAQPWRRMALVASASALSAAAVAAFVPGLSSSFARILNPFVSSAVERAVRIVPGDARVPQGSDVEITLETIDARAAAPELLIRTSAGWDPAVPESDGRVRRYRLRNILEPVAYRVRWRGESSRRFEITPVPRARIASVSARITPPAYTGKPAFVQQSPEIAALSGSQAEVTAETSLDLSSADAVFSDGREKPAERLAARKIRIAFAVAGTGTYHFRLTDAAGNVTETEPYPIVASEDRPPEIELLSPTESLSIGEREKLPLTFDVRDDVALAEVRVEWEGNRGKESLSAVRFREDRDGGILTFDWDLAAAGLRPGDRIRYRLAAIDANTVTGPGIGHTGWLGLDVASFEREHEALEQALAAWRDKSVDLLAQVNSLKSRADKGLDRTEAIAGDFNNAAQLSSRLEAALEAIVSKMESDPLSDFGVMTEHQAIAEGYRAMNRSLVPAARGALNTGNRQGASSALDAMASEIERMTALSEELTKRQNARDAIDRGDALEKLGKDLLERLDGAAPNDPALMRQLQDIIQEAAKNLQELARSLQKMPDQLPEDFVNQQALKDIKLGSAQEMLQKIADAVRSGDMKGALAMAREFLKMTQDVREKLSDAHESYSSSGSAAELMKKIEEEQKKLSAAIAEQRALLSRTQQLETHRLERTMKAQENAFARLAERQRSAIAMAREALTPLVRTPQGIVFSAQVGPMLEVLRELETRKIDKGFEYLNSIVAQLRPIAVEVARSSATAGAAESVRRIADEEAAILAELTRLREARPEAPAAERPEFDALSRSQEALARQTHELRQRFQALSRMTASLGLPLTEALNKAAAEMKGASGSLGESDSRAALGHEQSALAALQDAESTLSQAQQSMSQMSQGGGSGGSPRIIARPSGSGGKTGSRSSPVRFPTADDYRPPREFREDLMESLKENYPKIYEEIIHRYYRRLAD